MKANLSTNLSPKRSGQDLSENKQNPQPANERFAAFMIRWNRSRRRKSCQQANHLSSLLTGYRDFSKGAPPAPKLNVVVWDDLAEALIVHPEKAVATFEGHDVGFCCLGASRQDAIRLLYNPEKFIKSLRTVDYEYVVGVASATHRAGAPYFSVLSSGGTDPAARFLFSRGLEMLLRIKGEMERALQDIGFAGLSIFRPSQLTRDAPQRGAFLERAGLPMHAFLDRLMTPRYKLIQVEAVAEGMKKEFESRMMKPGEKVAIYESEIIRELVGPLEQSRVA